MTAGKMHEGEVDIDADLVRRLLRAQFPEWSALPVEPVHSTGTVNAIFRLGIDMCVRLPRVGQWAGHLENERQWLPVLAPQLSLPVPEPLAHGEPDLGYPFAWAVYRWLEGETFDREAVRDEVEAAADLAVFVASVRRVDPTGGPVCRRDQPARSLDPAVRATIASLRGAIDTDAATEAWEHSLAAPKHDGPAVWNHSDLIPPNLLVEHGRLSAVLDFGGAGVGDPAVDVIAAWSLFGPEARHAFRAALDVDDAAWARARGLALHQALMIVPYYPETNPAFVTMAMRTVSEVLADFGKSLD